MSDWPQHIHLHEEGPREGFQIEPLPIATEPLGPDAPSPVSIDTEPLPDADAPLVSDTSPD